MAYLFNWIIYPGNPRNYSGNPTGLSFNPTDVSGNPTGLSGNPIKQLVIFFLSKRTKISYF